MYSLKYLPIPSKAQLHESRREKQGIRGMSNSLNLKKCSLKLDKMNRFQGGFANLLRLTSHRTPHFFKSKLRGESEPILSAAFKFEVRGRADLDIGRSLAGTETAGEDDDQVVVVKSVFRYKAAD